MHSKGDFNCGAKNLRLLGTIHKIPVLVDLHRYDKEDMPASKIAECIVRTASARLERLKMLCRNNYAPSFLVRYSVMTIVVKIRLS